jgi:hypothetical protein
VSLLLLLLLLQAKLRVVPWDGYLKYYNLGEKHPGLIEKRRKVRGVTTDCLHELRCTQDMD